MRILPIITVFILLSQYGHAEDEPLQLLERIPLPGVTGRIDHLAIDTKNKRLFIAALGNDSLEVVDLRKRKRVRSVTGFREPQGVLFLTDSDRLVVSNGGDGKCLLIDATTFETVRQFDLHEDADNLRYDVTARKLYVAYGSGAVAIFDNMLEKIGDIPLPGHPEAFALDGDRDRLYINVPSTHTVVVADLESRREMEAWRLRDGGWNFPMALDEDAHVVLVGVRHPSRIDGFDVETGNLAFTVPIDGDPDDIFIDSGRRRVYVSCGAGFLDVLEWSDSDGYRVVKKVTTAPGARTALFVPEMQRLFLAVPRRGKQTAAVWVYAVNG